VGCWRFLFGGFRCWGEETKGKVLEAEIDAEDAGFRREGLEVSCRMAQALDEDTFGPGFGETA
jgi:hypothetical protein